jgi:hypothetical protein
MMQDTQNLWKIDQLANGGWRLTFYRGTEAFDCGTPTRTDTPLALVLEFIEFNAQPFDLVSVCGSLYQLGNLSTRA